jgi:hypothetical protein
MTNALLDRCARKIRLLERNTVNAVYEIGALLEQVAGVCEHGLYQDWIAREFGWSYRTSLRYRGIFALAEKCQCVTFEGIDVSLTALYFVAELGDPLAAKAVLEAAKTRRVTLRVARELVGTDRESEADEPETSDTVEDDPPLDAAPGPDDPPPDAPDPSSPGKLATSLNVLLAAHGPDEWRVAIEQIGGDQLRLIIAILERAHIEHCDSDAIRDAADRAEARSRIHLMEARA